MTRLVRASALQLPLASASFDVITMLGVIEHLDDDKDVCAELHRVCRPGGIVLFLTSAYQFLWSRHDEIVHHKRRYTDEQFRKLLERVGFETIRSSYVNAILFPLVLAIRLAQRMLGITGRGRTALRTSSCRPGSSIASYMWCSGPKPNC